MLIFQLIEYIDKDNAADINEYQQPNSTSTWFGFYNLAEASWKDLSCNNVSNSTVLFTANNESHTVLPFLANGSLSLKARQPFSA